MKTIKLYFVRIINSDRAFKFFFHIAIGSCVWCGVAFNHFTVLLLFYSIVAPAIVWFFILLHFLPFYLFRFLCLECRFVGSVVVFVIIFVVVLFTWNAFRQSNKATSFRITSNSMRKIFCSQTFHHLKPPRRCVYAGDLSLLTLSLEMQRKETIVWCLWFFLLGFQFVK